MLFYIEKRDRLSANKQQSFFTNLKSHFKVMYLCNYNQKMSEKYFLWAIGKIPLFMRFFIMFMFMSIGISYAETVHSQNAAMEFRFQDVTIEKALKEIEKRRGTISFIIRKILTLSRRSLFLLKE